MCSVLSDQHTLFGRSKQFGTELKVLQTIVGKVYGHVSNLKFIKDNNWFSKVDGPKNGLNGGQGDRLNKPDRMVR